MTVFTLPAIAPDVVHETIDGEAIVINLATGTYFSLDGSGAEVWSHLLRGGVLDDAVLALAETHSADPVALGAEVARLLGELHAHGLVLSPPPEVLAQPARPEALGTFVPPHLGVYTDMEEFLLADPIHEVEPAAGWPHVAT
jgi:hypothetical protein